MAKKPTKASVIARLREFNRIGRPKFLKKYASGFGARAYYIRYRGRLYDMKAVWAAAHDPPAWCGGFNTSEPYAELPRLGFDVISASEAEALERKRSSADRSMHLVHGDSVDDKADLIEAAKSKRKLRWIVPRQAQVGDDVVIFVNSAFFATARIYDPPKRREDWNRRFGATIGSVKLLSPPISIGVIKKRLPELSWAKYPRSIHTPIPSVITKLRRIISQRQTKKGWDIVREAVKTKNGANLSYAEHKFSAISCSRRSLAAKIGKRTYRTRSRTIHAFVLRRAEGNCEGCRHRAPFKRQDGEPYLESHHTLHVSDNGPDHPETIIALCPTCHKRAHHSHDKVKFNERLKRKLRNEIKRHDQTLLTGAGRA